MAFLEANRYLYLTTPLGDDKLLLRGFEGDEALSRLFSFELDLQAENTTSVDFDKLIGQKVSFGVQGADPGQTPRHFHGIVVEMVQGARDARLTSYSMTVAPEIWKLSCRYRSRIFQHIKIPDMLKQLFTGFDATYEIQGSFEQREYVVQYQESDLDFASRLMEEEGIYYFFKFTRGAHKLVLANTPQSHPDLPGGSQVIFEAVEGGERDDERITSWTKEQHWGSGKYTLWDHHFQLPHKKLEAEQIVMDSVQAGKVTHKLKLSGNEETGGLRKSRALRATLRRDRPGRRRKAGRPAENLRRQQAHDGHPHAAGGNPHHPDSRREQPLATDSGLQVHSPAPLQCRRPICGHLRES